MIHTHTEARPISATYKISLVLAEVCESVTALDSQRNDRSSCVHIYQKIKSSHIEMTCRSKQQITKW